jgi:hypothetical protein
MSSIMILKASHSTVIETSYLRPRECPREKDLSYYLLLMDGTLKKKQNKLFHAFMQDYSCQLFVLDNISLLKIQ